MDIYVSAKDRFELSSTSKGNQIKWFKDNTYIKADTLGYEGFAEALTSELLHYIKSDYSFIDYYLCTINEDDRVYSGCYSDNYLKANESFISFYRILQQYDKNIDNLLKKYNGKDLINFVVNIIKQMSSIDCYEYLGYICKFDAIIYNEDRHFNNLNLIYNSISHTFSLSPIFDNGLSLLSDTHDYPLTTPYDKCMQLVKCKPFTTNFRKQYSYFSDLDLIKIDFDSFMNSLVENDKLFNSPEYIRAKNVLLKSLKSKEGIVWQRV
jgi:hypothetical protein